MLTIKETGNRMSGGTGSKEKITYCPHCKGKIFFWSYAVANCRHCNNRIPSAYSIMKFASSRLEYHFDKESIIIGPV